MSESGVTQFCLADEEATLSFGHLLAPLLSKAAVQSAFVVFLAGPLGAGKTTLVRGVLRHLGIRGRVRSPTYTLIETYEAGALTVVHVDLYRIANAAETAGLGLREFDRPQTLWLVEWPQRGDGYLPAPGLSVSLSLAERDTRTADVQAGSAEGAILVQELLSVCEPK